MFFEPAEWKGTREWSNPDVIPQLKAIKARMSSSISAIVP